MEYDLRQLEHKLTSKNTPYIIVYPHPGIDVTGFTHDLRRLLNKYHGHNQGWTIGSNIEVHGIPLVDALSEPDEPRAPLH